MCCRWGTKEIARHRHQDGYGSAGMGRADPSPISGPDLFGGRVAKSRSENRKLAAVDFTAGGVLAAVGTGETRRGPLRKQPGILLQMVSPRLPTRSLQGAASSPVMN